MKNLILTLIITLPLTLLGQGWEQTYGGVSNDYGKSVQQTNDGGYVITGGTDGDVWLIKTDEDGNEQWSQTFGENGGGYSVQQTNDGGYIITGITYSDNNIWYDVCLIKTDENGEEQWTKTFGEISGGINGRDYGESVQQTQDGGYIITGGTSYETTLSSDLWLIKTDGNGNELWTKTFGGSETSNHGYSVRQTTDGGYVISGYTVVNVSDYILDVCLIKTDGNGNELWSKTFGGPEDDGGNSVQQTQDGGYIITGITNSSSGNEYMYLIKTDSNGNELWSNTFGGIGGGTGESVQQTQDGGYIITGYTWIEDEQYLYLIKTDDQGNITSTFEIPLPNTDRKLEKTINLKGQEVKPQTGQPIIEIFDDGSTQKKIIIE